MPFETSYASSAGRGETRNLSEGLCVLLASVLLTSYVGIAQDTFNVVLAFHIFLLCTCTLLTRQVSANPAVLFTVALAYSMWTVLGVSNPALLLDHKYHLAWLISFLLFNCVLARISDNRLLVCLTWINVVIVAIYIALYLDVLPNIYQDGIIPRHRAYRVSGPTLTTFFAVPFLANATAKMQGRRPTLLVLVNVALGSVVFVLSGSLANMVIFALLYALHFLDTRHLVRTLGLLGAFCTLMVLALQFGTESHIQEIQQLTNPLASSSIQTRVFDLYYMVSNTTNSIGEIVLGSGWGVTSEALRFSRENPVRMEYRTFLEIDNGFFYVYHRTGLIGLLTFLGVHAWLILRNGIPKNRVAFSLYFVITNCLSIHYITAPHSVLLFYLLLRQK